MKQTQSKTSGKLWRDFLPVILLLAFFLFLFLFWNRVSWIASADVWRQTMADVFPQWFSRPYVMAPKNPALISGTPLIDDRPAIKSDKNAATSAAQKPRRDIITIPKIGVTAPIITAKTSNAEVIHGLLDSGVVLYPGSTPFGQTGQTALLGHSAPAGWPKIKYDWVFSRLDELKEGDMIVVTYDRETRYYKVVASQVIKPQEGMPSPTVPGNSLMLVTCWPPGQDLKRYTVEATIFGTK